MDNDTESNTNSPDGSTKPSQVEFTSDLENQLREIEGSTLKSNYGISDGVKDLISAIKRNPVAITLVVTLNAVILVLVQAFVNSISPYDRTSYMPSAEAVFTYAVVAIALSLLTTVFAQITLGLTVADGAEGRVSRLQPIVTNGLKSFLRVIITQILLFIVLLSPIIVALLMAYGILKSIDNPTGTLIVSLFALAVGLFIMLVFALRLALLPVIALLEPDTPIKKILNRNKVIMTKGGLVFMIRLTIVGVVATLIFYSATVMLSRALNMSITYQAFSQYFPSLALLFYFPVLVMFYKNRVGQPKP